LGKVEINGRLTFRDDDNLDLTLQAESIWIRNGTLNIGTETNPHRHKAIIRLGDSGVRRRLVPGTIEGDKILLNTGEMNIYGQPRVNYLPRLEQPVYPGEDFAILEDSMDIFPDDILFFGPTAM